jgi:hypothetical protein
MTLFIIKKTLIMTFILSLLVGLGSFLSINSNAVEGGIGISGSFNGVEIKMVPGETFDTEGVYISIFNEYDVDVVVNIDVRLQDESRELVEGLTYLFDQGNITIPKNDYVEFPISFAVEPFMLPGSYTVSIGATLVQEFTPGIIAVPVVRQRAFLEILGEAGDLSFDFVDAFGNSFEGRIEIFRVEETRLLSVATTDGSTITERLVPGTYRVQMKYEYDGNDFIVFEEDFELKSEDVLDETFVVQTVSLDSFIISPLLGDDGTLLNAILNYRIRNIYEEIDDVSVSLEVLYKGERIERFIIQELSLLGLGLTSLRSNYVPPEGWQNGIYSFQISLFTLDENFELIELLVGEPEVINVTSMATDALPILWVIIGASVLASIGVVMVILLLRSKKKDTDIICLDDDPAYIEELSKLIDGGKK